MVFHVATLRARLDVDLSVPETARRGRPTVSEATFNEL
jgi:hypothetical protein